DPFCPPIGIDTQYRAGTLPFIYRAFRNGRLVPFCTGRLCCDYTDTCVRRWRAHFADLCLYAFQQGTSRRPAVDVSTLYVLAQLAIDVALVGIPCRVGVQFYSLDKGSARVDGTRTGRRLHIIADRR